MFLILILSSSIFLLLWENTEQNHLGKERVCWAYSLQSITERSQDMNSSQELKQRPWGALLTGLQGRLSISTSTACLPGDNSAPGGMGHATLTINKKMPPQMPTGQSTRANSSSDTSSKVTLVCVTNLTSPTILIPHAQHISGTLGLSKA